MLLFPALLNKVFLRLLTARNTSKCSGAYNEARGLFLSRDVCFSKGDDYENRYRRFKRYKKYRYKRIS